MAAVIAAVALPSNAGAATQLGETFVPATTFCDPSFTNIAAGSPASSYTVPAPGVITSWRYQADATPGLVAFKVVRSNGGSNFTILADSGLVGPAPSQLITTAARIPVSGGEVLGIYTSNAECGRSAGGYTIFYDPGNFAAGSTRSYSGPASYQLDVAATLEPDADNDGFGDESQDACPADASLQQAPCDRVAPDTTIVKRPKDKTKKKQAEFEFTSSEPGSSFECALDGSAFAACTSPLLRTLGKGKHVFQVRATDAAGNVDASPASDDWKVKKKKKR